VPACDDCDDRDAASHPGAAERCDGADNDCDGRADEGALPGVGEGCATGDPGVCAQGALECIAGELRCKRAQAPSGETCDGADNDCDGQTDEGQTTPFWRDADGDGYGDPASPERACAPPPGFVTNADDCYDGNASARPGQWASFSSHRGDDSFDYDCDDVATPALADLYQCVPHFSWVDVSHGWEGGLAGCGETKNYFAGGTLQWTWWGCYNVPWQPTTQACR
jgi:hypothetical protein